VATGDAGWWLLLLLGVLLHPSFFEAFPEQQDTSCQRNRRSHFNVGPVGCTGLGECPALLRPRLPGMNGTFV
jgi:hypothetical protein